MQTRLAVASSCADLLHEESRDVERGVCRPQIDGGALVFFARQRGHGSRSTIHQGFAPGVPVGANPTADLLYEVGKVCWSTLDEVAVLFPLSPANGKASHDPLYTGDLPRAFCWAKILCRPAA